MIFGPEYAGVYDSLYVDKPYTEEARFALQQARTTSSSAVNRVLDLGCGTGIHAVALAKDGVAVTGVDRSAEMIRFAERRKQALEPEYADRLTFLVGDLRSADTGSRFDAVLSLFHVFCYMTTDDDFADALAAAHRHLAPHGALVFDFWHKAAVVKSPPAPREKTICTDSLRIHRTSVPQWDPERSLVQVTYEIETESLATGERTHEREEHPVRCFSQEEIRMQLDAAGFEEVRFGEWLTGAVPTEDSFGVFAAAARR